MLKLKKQSANQPPRLRTKEGFTLVELLLYITISGLILFSCASFLLLIQQTNVKNKVIAEVDEEGIQILEIMSQTLRNASAINAPAAGVSSAVSFSVNTQNSSNNPTVFDISGGVLRITQGSGSAVNLTTNRIVASNVLFTNVSRSGTSGALRLQFTLAYQNNSGTNEYTYSKTFYDTVSLR